METFLWCGCWHHRLRTRGFPVRIPAPRPISASCDSSQQQQMTLNWIRREWMQSHKSFFFLNTFDDYCSLLHRRTHLKVILVHWQMWWRRLPTWTRPGSLVTVGTSWWKLRHLATATAQLQTSKAMIKLLVISQGESRHVKSKSLILTSGCFLITWCTYWTSPVALQGNPGAVFMFVTKL